MSGEAGLSEKLRKIEALVAGAGTVGERLAAEAALERVRARLADLKQKDPAIEMQFSLPDPWSLRLFMALCRRYGMDHYRYRGQRHTTVMVRAPRSFIERTLWPEYWELKVALDEYLNEATQRIIREEVYRDAGEAPERA